MGSRPVHWQRDRFGQNVPAQDIQLTPTNIVLNAGETLVRLRWHYHLVGNAPASNVLANLDNTILAITLLTFGRFPPGEPTFGPWQSPQNSDGQRWLWWEGQSWENWRLDVADPRWKAPRSDNGVRDLRAQEVARPLGTDTTCRLWWWYQQDTAIDWQVQQMWVTASALIMAAP